MINFEIRSREALAAPTDRYQIHTQSIAIMVVSILSVLGAGWIMASFAVSPDNKPHLTDFHSTLTSTEPTYHSAFPTFEGSATSSSWA
jgi:hypothetical protein